MSSAQLKSVFDAYTQAQAAGTDAASARLGLGQAYGGAETTVRSIGVSRIAPDPNHPRTDCDDESIGRLARSLESHGQIQPITVRRDEMPGFYVIVTGERRLRACLAVGRVAVDAIVIEGEVDPGRALEWQLVENLQREDLTPLQQARAFRSLMQSNGWSARHLATHLSLSHTTVNRALGLLDLPPAVQDHVEAGRIAPSVADHIGRLDRPDQQTALAERVVAEGLTRVETVRAARGESPTPTRNPANPLPPSYHRVVKIPGGEVTISLDAPATTQAFFNALLQAGTLLSEDLKAEVCGPGRVRPTTAHADERESRKSDGGNASKDQDVTIFSQSRVHAPTVHPGREPSEAAPPAVAPRATPGRRAGKPKGLPRRNGTTSA